MPGGKALAAYFHLLLHGLAETGEVA